jgi:hypothetical protein
MLNKIVSDFRRTLVVLSLRHVISNWGLELFASQSIIPVIGIRLSSHLSNTPQLQCPIILNNILCLRGVVFEKRGRNFENAPLM